MFSNSAGQGLTPLGTAVPPEGMGEPFVIQFLGSVQTNGRGVVDDTGGGEGSLIRTEFFQGGEWTGSHHDRRRTQCPPVQDFLSFRVDVYAGHNYLEGVPSEFRTLLEGYTNIVSSAMEVERPDGSVVLVPPFTDIFSPDVDFVSEFRFLPQWQDTDLGDPIAGAPYRFQLLDALGRPIPGSVNEDTWNRCVTQAPGGYVANVMPGGDIELSWDAVAVEPEFDPANGVGFYQIGIDNSSGGDSTSYGASGIHVANHLVPWADFVAPSPGSPDGQDFGNGLSVLDDGDYWITVYSFSEVAPGNPGGGLECFVTDFSEVLILNKNGDQWAVY